MSNNPLGLNRDQLSKALNGSFPVIRAFEQLQLDQAGTPSTIEEAAAAATSALNLAAQAIASLSDLAQAVEQIGSRPETSFPVQDDPYIPAFATPNLGTLAEQEANSVAITGGAISNVALTATTLAFGSIVGGIGKAGSFIRTSSFASANVSYTGLGFKPSAVFFMCAVDTTPEACWGVSTPGAGRCLTSDGTNSKTSYPLAIKFIRLADTQQATMISADPDGFTLAWTLTGPGTTGNDIIVNYFAFR